MNKTKLVLALGLGLVALSPACKKEDKKGPGGSSSKPEAGGGGGGQFAEWDMAGRKAAFQGAHVSGREAWNVEGNKITVYDGTSEVVAELDLRSPCEAAVSVKKGDLTESTIHHYTIEGGKIVTGLGDAGSRKGPAAIACVSNKLVTLDAAGTCLEWEADMFEKTKFKSSPGTCSFGKDGDKDVFKATVNGMETSLEVHGDALYSTQIAQSPSEKAADWAAAKATRDEKNK